MFVISSRSRLWKTSYFQSLKSPIDCRIFYCVRTIHSQIQGKTKFTFVSTKMPSSQSFHVLIRIFFGRFLRHDFKNQLLTAEQATSSVAALFSNGSTATARRPADFNSFYEKRSPLYQRQKCISHSSQRRRDYENQPPNTHD